jgi:uncharacterized protein (TIGR02996 family)
MMTIHPTLKALLDTVCEQPTNATAKLVLADWLDENGYCGESMRWASRWGKNPSQAEGDWATGMLVDNPPSGWYFGISGSNESRRADVVPHCIFGVKIGRPDTPEYLCVPYKTPSQAWLAFIVAFGEAYKRSKIGRRQKTKETVA